ncbi:MAG: hypothetical protein KDB27_34640 [Planctomycetales bacterium]|nr:hypothetical protein [Planctomycetales bacterium]
MKVASSRLTSFVIWALLGSVGWCQVDEDFEAYPLGNIDGQGLWVDFGGVNLTEVSNDFAHSGDHSMKMSLSDLDPNPESIVGYGSDVFIDMEGRVRGGEYVISYWTYLPSDFNGANYAYFSEGSVGAGNFDYGTQLVASGDIDSFLYFVGGQAFGIPLIRDQWVEARQLIDLDENTVRITYGGDLLFDGLWDPDPLTRDDVPQFWGVNFWVQDVKEGEVPTGAMYIDDVYFGTVPVPEPAASTAMLLLACLTFGRRSVRRR